MDPSQSAVLVYITAGSLKEARRIGRHLVERRLAGCANVVPEVHSTYWWEGKLCEETEALLLVKTLRAAIPALMRAVRAVHSDAVPAISVIELQDVNPAYLDWLKAEVAVPGAAGGGPTPT
ncbi:MAG TPA: divalent-cation tolerance protein CutA [Limnochordia bacterium]